MSTEPRQQELGLRETGPVKRVEEYTFEPIRGYPMLQWAGKRPFTSTQYYPDQHKETHGPEVESWRNKIYWGDNIQVMSHLFKEYRGKVKLIYIDPPYDSKADYKRIIRIKDKETTNDRTIFEEKQYTDIWTNDEYLQFMYERLILIRELLSDEGSFYLHCDWHKAHHLRLILDEIFGAEAFRNEIIWWYITTPAPQKNFARQHDTIFFYSKSSNLIFNRDEVRVPYSEETLSKKASRRVFHQANKSYQQVPHELGKVCPDVWEIPFINPFAHERLDYPTQKPEAVIERIIKASSDPDDIIFDCFMGSGTTQAVAMKLGRRFLGADINLGAVQITTKRLLAVASELAVQSPTLLAEGEINTLYTGFEVYNVNNYDIFRNPVQAKELLIQALEVNPLQAGSLFDGEKDGRMVKIMPINRIATRQDLNELITGFDYKAFERRRAEHLSQPVEKIILVCMGHEPDLAAHLQHEVSPYKLDIEVVDILHDRQDLQFKRDAEAVIA